MKLVVFGATGTTGQEIVRQSLAQGYIVTAFARDPSKMRFEHGDLKITTGDVYDLSAVTQAIIGQDVVICSLGTSELGKTTVRSEGTANIINAMKESDVKRIIVITAMGVAESWSTLSFVNKLFFATLLRNTRQDHENQEVLVKDSDLDWTIIRPSGLTDTPRTEDYAIGENVHANTSRIARADVAHAIVKEVHDNAYVHKAVTITN
ncbi:MAG: NAD(P)-dependent oxidoreductase [Anaerolineales bacterium]